jgi:signal peptidase II
VTRFVVSQRTAWIRFALVAVGCLVLDIASKVAAVSFLRPGEPVPLLGDLFRLYLIRNPGAAFSIGEGATWVFTMLAAGVLVFILVAVLPKLRHGGWAVGLGLVVAGISGNLIDRLVRPPGFARGHVVDFLQLPYWPIFNVADMCVVFGAITILVFWLVKGVGHDGVLESDKEGAGRPCPEESGDVGDDPGVRHRAAGT